MLKTFVSHHSINNCQIKTIITNGCTIVTGKKLCHNNKQPSITPIRFFKSKFPKIKSQWPDGFENPIPHKTDIPAMRDSGEYEKKALAPIKSAAKSASCSLFRDPLVDRFERLCRVHGRAQQAENNLMVSFL